MNITTYGKRELIFFVSLHISVHITDISDFDLASLCS